MIVRRTEKFRANELEKILPYLEEPVESTCLIFVSARADFNKKFYRKIRDLGRSVHFRELKDAQVVSWIRRMAGELGLDMDGQACVSLHQVVGNSLRDLYAELEKLSIRYGRDTVSAHQVKELAIHSRVYNVFELMNAIGSKNCAASLGVLNTFLEEQDKRKAPLQVLGMLNRQLRLLWQAKLITAKGGQTKDVAQRLGLAHFSATSFIRQSKYWSETELEKGIGLLYEADGLLKAGSRPEPVLENLIISLCV
jgi:DNA polymerase-3 subunit delta